MSIDLESLVRNENKSRVRWGFIIALVCAALWGSGYVSLTMLWIVPPYGDFAIFPEGMAGFLVAAITMTSFMAIAGTLILSIFWLGSTGKFWDLPRTFLNFKISKWFILGAVLGGPVAIMGTNLAVGYIGGAFAAAAALLCSVVGAITAKVWYGENITRRAWIGICLILVGGIFILNPVQMLAELSNPASPDGIWLGYLGGIMAAIGWGVEGAVAGRALDVTDADSGLVSRYVGESLIWLSLIWPASMLVFGVDTMTTAIVATASSPSFLIWVSLVTLTAILAYVFLYKTFPLIGVGRGLSMSTLYVPTSIAALIIFMAMPIGWWILAGAVLAITGTFTMYWESGESLLECTRDCSVAVDEIKEGEQ